MHRTLVKSLYYVQRGKTLSELDKAKFFERVGQQISNVLKVTHSYQELRWQIKKNST